MDLSDKLWNNSYVTRRIDNEQGTDNGQLFSKKIYARGIPIKTSRSELSVNSNVGQTSIL